MNELSEIYVGLVATRERYFARQNNNNVKSFASLGNICTGFIFIKFREIILFDFHSKSTQTPVYHLNKYA